MAKIGFDTAETGPSKVWIIDVPVYRYRHRPYRYALDEGAHQRDPEQQAHAQAGAEVLRGHSDVPEVVVAHEALVLLPNSFLDRVNRGHEAIKNLTRTPLA